MTDRSRLDGRVALVVGAGQIGRATARRLADAGAEVAVADLREAAATDVAAQLGRPAVGLGVDVGDDESTAAAVARVVDRFGRVDILFNNAAATGDDVLGRDIDIVDMPLSVWDHTFAVNLRGPMLCCRHVLPHMIEAGSGTIVNTVSVAAHAGDLTFPAYGASKAALVNLTKSIATRYGPAGVRCNAVAPGLILTDTAKERLGPDAVARFGSHYLTPRLGTTDDVADAVAYLASDAAGFITGHVLDVDGGVTAHLPHVADARGATEAG